MSWSGYSEKGQGSLERGPGKFSVDVPGIVQKPDGADFVGVKASGDMRSSGRLSVPVGLPQDNTITELAKMGQALLAPKIKEEQDRRFIEGMSRAASGVALQEIIDEQPAYVTIFGEAPAVEGARAYTTSARVSAWTAQQHNNMSELAKVDTSELGGVVLGSMQEQLTGDPIADADMQKAMLGQMPDLIRTQTKARYLHLQKEAKAARRTAMSAVGERYSAVHNAEPGTVAVDQMDKAEADVMQLFTPAPGSDEISHMEDVTDTITLQLQSGNFDVARLAYETGIVGQLPPEAQAKIRVAAMRAAPDALAKTMPGFIPRIIAAANLPPDEFIAEVQAINAAAAGESRVPLEYGQLLGEDYMLRGAQASANRMHTANERQLLALKKEAAEKTKGVLLSGVIQSALADPDAGGDLNFSTLEAKLPALAFKTGEVDAALGSVLLDTVDPVMQARVMNKFAGAKISVGSDMIRASWESINREGAKWETHGAQFGKLVTLYQSLSPIAKKQYFSTDQMNTLDSWTASLRTEAPTPEARARDVQQVFETRATLSRIDSNRLRDDPDAATAEGAVIKVLETELTTGLWRVDSPRGFDQVTNTNVGATELLAARSVVQSGMRAYTGAISQEERATRALAGAEQEGIFTVAGGRLIFNENPAEAKKNPLSAFTGQNDESSALALEGIIQERVRARKGDDDTRLVIRAPGPQIKYIVTFETDGKQMVEVITADEVKARLNKPKAKAPSGRGVQPANPVN